MRSEDVAEIADDLEELRNAVLLTSCAGRLEPYLANADSDDDAA